MDYILKVCIITSWYPNVLKPHLAPYVHQFAVALQNQGIDTSILTTSTSMNNTFEQIDNLKIFRVNSIFPLPFMLQILNKIQPNIIHIHAPNQFSSNALIISKLLKIPVITTVHRAEIDKTNFFFQMIRRVILSSLRNVVAVSKYSKELAIRAGVQPNAISIIYNSCDEDQFVQKTEPMPKFSDLFTRDEKVILFVGNVIKIKGIDVLIESLSYLRSKINYHTVIIGSGEALNEAKQKVINLGLDQKVSFLGWLPPSELASFYRIADVFVLPSFTEGNSVALLEAMYNGIPIIASKVGGNPESVIDDFNGYLFNVGDSVDLLTKLEKILTDDSLRDHLASNCRNLYNNKFSRKMQIDQYLFLYSKVVKSG